MKFWIEINSDHASFSSHLLDVDTNKDLRDQTRSILATSEKGYSLIDHEVDFLQMVSFTKAMKFIDHVGETQAKLWNGGNFKQSNNIIHPTLIAHVIRENERSRHRLQKLKINVPSKEIIMMNKLKQHYHGLI